MFLKQYILNGYIRLFGYVDDRWELLSDGYADDSELDYFEENTVTKDAILYGNRMQEYLNCNVIRIQPMMQLDFHSEAINICIDARQALQ